jgi:hypothetical protein
MPPLMRVGLNVRPHGPFEARVYGYDVFLPSLLLAGRDVRRALRRSAARFVDASLQLPTVEQAHLLVAAVAKQTDQLHATGHPIESYVPAYILEEPIAERVEPDFSSASLNRSLAASYLYDAEDNLVVTGPNIASRAEFKMNASVTERIGARGPFKFCSIPKGELRKLIRPKTDAWQVVSLDLNAADCRSIASLDWKLTETYGDDPDYHGRTAEVVFGRRDEQLRKIAKAAFNAIAYGGGASAVSEATGLSHERSLSCIRMFSEKLPELDEIRNKMIASLPTWHKTGNIDTSGATHSGAVLARVAQTLSSRAFIGSICFVCALLERDGGGQLLFTVNDEIVLEADPAIFGSLVEAAEAGASAAIGHPYRVRLKSGPSYGEVE